MRDLPPLTALPAFEATARLGSVTDAAIELRRTHGAISKQIQNLSEALGYPLFEKDGNKLRLTPQGVAFQAVVAQSLDTLAVGWAEARKARPGIRLQLGVSATFASRWLMPRLPRFHARHPGIEVDFHMAGRELRTPPQHIDLTISWDRLRLPTTLGRYEPLGDVSYLLVHAPRVVLERRDQRWHTETRIVPDTLLTVFEAWEKLSDIKVTGDRDYKVPQTGLIIDAACSGMGVAILERRLIEEELQDERLIAPFGMQTIQDGLGVFLPPPDRETAESRLFIDWLRDEA